MTFIHLYLCDMTYLLLSTKIVMSLRNLYFHIISTNMLNLVHGRITYIIRSLWELRYCWNSVNFLFGFGLLINVVAHLGKISLSMWNGQIRKPLVYLVAAFSSSSTSFSFSSSFFLVVFILYLELHCQGEHLNPCASK